jgi:hypothetical protein
MNAEMGKKEAETDEEWQGLSTILFGAAMDLHGIGDQFAGAWHWQTTAFPDGGNEISL